MAQPQQYHRRTHSAPSTPISASKIASNATEEKEIQEHAQQPHRHYLFDEDHDDGRAYFNSPQPPVLSQQHRRVRSRSSSSTLHRSKQQRVVYESPRLYTSDDVLFPASKHGPLRNASYLQSYETRFQYIQSVQRPPGSYGTSDDPKRRCGQGENDMSIFRIHYNMIHHRKVTPKAVQQGLLRQCAIRIQTLYLPIIPKENESLTKYPKSALKNIIVWLDMIAITFPNLQHLYVQNEVEQQQQQVGTEKPITFLNHAVNIERGVENDRYTSALVTQPETSMEKNNQLIFTFDEINLLRKYIIYRIPALQTLDGIFITAHERKDAMLSKSKKSSQQHQVQQLSSHTDKKSFTQQARAKIFASNITKTKAARIKKKLSNSIPQPITFCLLDGMDDEEVEDNENDDPAKTVSTPKELEHRRVIMASDTAVEVKQQSPDKLSIRTGVRSSNHRRSLSLDHSNDRVVQSPSYFNDSNIQSNDSDAEDDNVHLKWEYVSVGESSVQAMGACAAWTTACGSLSSLPYYYFQKKNDDRDLSDQGQYRSKNDMKNKKDRLKTKFQLLQNRKKMIQGNVRDHDENNITTRSNNAKYINSTQATNSINPFGNSKAIEVDVLSLENNCDVPSNIPPSLQRNSNVRADATDGSVTLLSKMKLHVGANTKAVTNVRNVLEPNVSSTSIEGNVVLKTVTDTVVTHRVSTSTIISAPCMSMEKPNNSEKVNLTYAVSRTQSSPTKLPSLNRSTKIDQPPAATRSLNVKTKNDKLPPPRPGNTIRYRNISATMIRQGKSTTMSNSATYSPPRIPQCNSTTKASSLRRKEHSTNDLSHHEWRDSLSLRSCSLLDDDDDNNNNCFDGFVHSDDDDVFVIDTTKM
jgi:hypothetical protein